MSLRRIAPGVHEHCVEQGFYGLEVGARMTVFELEGGLLLHSPTALGPALLEPLGQPRWLLAPNSFHHLYVGPWIERGVQAWCSPSLVDKRPDLDFHAIVKEPCEPFGPEVLLFPLDCFAMTREVLLLHRPSRTLVVTDLVFNFGPEAPALTRTAMWFAGGYPGCSTTVLERVGMDRALAREELRQVLELDFDRLVPCHGRVIETGGREALRAAFSWLGL